MNHTKYSKNNSATWYKPRARINFIIAVNACSYPDGFDSSLLQGEAPEGIFWPGQVTYVLTPAQIKSGFCSDEITVPPLQAVLLDRGYSIEQLEKRKVVIVLFQVYRQRLESSFSQIWRWAFSKEPAINSDSRDEPVSNCGGLKLNRIGYDDMGNASCPVIAGDRGLLDVSGSTLLLSGSFPAHTANLFCPELIHASRPTVTPEEARSHLVSSVA